VGVTWGDGVLEVSADRCDCGGEEGFYRRAQRTQREGCKGGGEQKEAKGRRRVFSGSVFRLEPGGIGVTGCWKFRQIVATAAGRKVFTEGRKGHKGKAAKAGANRRKRRGDGEFSVVQFSDWGEVGKRKAEVFLRTCPKVRGNRKALLQNGTEAGFYGVESARQAEPT